MRHFTSTQDWTVDELQALLDQAAGLRSNPVRPLLQGRTLALLFLNRSLRTRASFQIGAHSWAPRRSYWNRGRCCAAANLGGWLCPENCGIWETGPGRRPSEARERRLRLSQASECTLSASA